MKIRTVLLSLLGVLLLFIAAGLFTFGAKRWNVSQKLASIRNSGAPASFAQLLADQPPTSANDAAAHLESVRDLAERMFLVLRPMLYVRLHNRLAVCRVEYLATSRRADEAVEVCLSQFQLLDIQDSGFGLVHFLTLAACRSEMVQTIDAISGQPIDHPIYQPEVPDSPL